VTVRDRDTTDQVRVPIADLVGHLQARFAASEGAEPAPGS
jgi:glycyl-tRNA synthetase (class II)